MTTKQKPKIDLLTRAQSLAQTLHKEGRGKDAKTVVALLDALKPSSQPEFLTTGQVAKRVGVSRQSIVNWVNRGSLPGTRIGGRIMIPVAALTKFDELNSILAALDEDRPPATDEEIRAALEPERKDWTWVGKEG